MGILHLLYNYDRYVGFVTFVVLAGQRAAISFENSQ